MDIRVPGGVAGPSPPVMDTILEWIGFDQEATRDRIRVEGFETLDRFGNDEREGHPRSRGVL